MGIPKGNKSSVVDVPSKIINGSKEIKKNFLAGYFDADGGFRGNSIGFTTASKNLHQNISILLDEFGVLHSKEEWVNKRYNKTYFGIKLRKKEIDNFLNTFPFQNQEKLVRIKKRFMRGCRSGQTG